MNKSFPTDFQYRLNPCPCSCLCILSQQRQGHADSDFAVAWCEVPSGPPRDTCTCDFQKEMLRLRNPGFSRVVADTDLFPTTLAQPQRDSSSFPILVSFLSVFLCLPILSLGFLPLCKRLCCSVVLASQSSIRAPFWSFISLHFPQGNFLHLRKTQIIL